MSILQFAVQSHGFPVNDEIRMPNVEGMERKSKPEEKPLFIRASLLIRHSSFVIRHC
jgi:hypothetical protein